MPEKLSGGIVARSTFPFSEVDWRYHDVRVFHVSCRNLISKNKFDIYFGEMVSENWTWQNLHKNIVSIENMMQSLVWSINLVKFVIVNVCDDHVITIDTA